MVAFVTIGLLFAIGTNLIFQIQPIYAGSVGEGQAQDLKKAPEVESNPDNEIQKVNLSSQEAFGDLVNKLDALEKSLENFEKATEADPNVDEAGTPDTIDSFFPAKPKGDDVTPKEKWTDLILKTIEKLKELLQKQ